MAWVAALFCLATFSGMCPKKSSSSDRDSGRGITGVPGSPPFGTRWLDPKGLDLGVLENKNIKDQGSARL